MGASALRRKFNVHFNATGSELEVSIKIGPYKTTADIEEAGVPRKIVEFAAGTTADQALKRIISSRLNKQFESQN